MSQESLEGYGMPKSSLDFFGCSVSISMLIIIYIII